MLKHAATSAADIATTRNGTLLAETDILEARISELESLMASLESDLHAVVKPIDPVAGDPTADVEELPSAVDYVRNLRNRVKRISDRVYSIRDRLQLS